jgi:hypothetical protein
LFIFHFLQPFPANYYHVRRWAPLLPAGAVTGKLHLEFRKFFTNSQCLLLCNIKCPHTDPRHNRIEGSTTCELLTVKIVCKLLDKAPFLRWWDVFWVVAPCSLVEVYWRFSGAFCLHHQDDPDDGGSKQISNFRKVTTYFCRN